MTPVVGVFGIGMGPCATAAGLRDVGTLAEELGYESVWAPEHTVLPSPRRSPSPLDPDHPILDPLIALALVAGVTRRVRLGTGVLILPQHNPVRLAKAVASLDVVSDGRAVLGLGVGYLEPEMEAMGVSPRGRGARSDEFIEAMQALWYDKAPAMDGRHVSFSQVDAHPRPVQARVPLVVGGRTEAAFRRAVRYGSGWYGFALDRAAVQTCISALRTAAEAAGRDLSELTITVTPNETLTPEVVADYAQLGVHRLAVMRPGSRDRVVGWSEFEEFVRANAPREIGATAA
ncbi:LLM class F420-dependent oxidoreductase [Catenulispora sp. NF23]|uniref:LLM class F420-dependent oxidoreductase n=1 Tax=Catenulispora pinistramenti TaxID=2705254 RepID=A0ABS5L3C5_9ACTN|nr:LLM class F420-dependent oxidoreductase [Catenulispora pinistramenti]MBS2537173.1 LLM class F420-dependent oxidoreductase [Catenulispora pinistramenti]MBS2552852.1 LLM class F420-dependent oxidoreductase [Catenulispora pinistramenti]